MDKKKRRRVRTRDWEKEGEFSFTHDRAKHRRATVRLPETPSSQNPLPTEFEANGTVISHAKKWAFVELDHEERLCLIDEGLLERSATLLAPGDRVLVEFEGEDAVVRGVAPRRTRLSRPGGEHGRIAEQIFAANIDILIVVAAAADPPFRVGLIDRYLIAAMVGQIEPILCVNKMDLVAREPEAVAIYRDLGIRIFPTSCETGAGIPALREALSGKFSVLSGHSGVGKSSLLNAMDSDLELHTKEVSESSQRGRHTTSASRLYVLDERTRIIDTPGIRSLGLWGVSATEAAAYFPEIGEASARCRFRDCTHTHEPNCAVLTAVEEEIIPRARYDSYLRIRASLESDRGMTPGRMAPGEDTGQLI